MDVSNASGYDGTTVAADACFVARHVTDRRKVVLSEALNPQVRQVVKTYAPGFGFEVVEVPQRDGRHRPGRARRRLGRRRRRVLPAAELPRLSRGRAGAGGGRERGRRPADGARRPDVPRRPRGAGRLRLRARDRGRPVGGQLALVRRAALRLPRRALGLRPADARAHRRRDARRRRAPRVRPHAPDPRAAHPPREGDVEHHDESDAPRARGPRHAVLARARQGLRELGETCLALPQYARERLPLEPAFEAGSFKEVAFRTPLPAREVVRRAREHGVNPGYALGRDYEGMDDVLLVAVTEKRSVEDVDRLADVLAEVCG